MMAPSREMYPYHNTPSEARTEYHTAYQLYTAPTIKPKSYRVQFSRIADKLHLMGKILYLYNIVNKCSISSKILTGGNMCGRYTIFTDAAALEARFHAYVPPSLLAPSYNAAPSQGLPTILSANPYVITVSVWGFRPEWADWRDVTPIINARAETVATKPFFRQAFRTKRCLVLADGFYEWKRTGKGKVPYRIALKTGEPFAFAGIWSLGQDAQRRPWSTFAILTTEANRLVAQLHNRMPVIPVAG